MINVVDDKGNGARVTDHVSPQHARETRRCPYMGIERFFFENAIPFDVMTSLAFTNMIYYIESYGCRLRPHTMYELLT